jgi:hypothetical protein
VRTGLSGLSVDASRRVGSGIAERMLGHVIRGVRGISDRREARRPRSLGQADSRYRRATAGQRRRASRRSGLAVRDDAGEGAGPGCRAGRGARVIPVAKMAT